MSVQARQRRHRQRGAAPFRVPLILLGAFVACCVFGGLAIAAYVASVVHSTPGLAARHPVPPGSSSQVLAADGTRLGFIQSSEVRTPVSWSQIPTPLKEATVAIEDQRFYQTDAIDVTGILRAAVRDLSAGEPLQGASTITMQLIRNLYLPDYEHTLRQKIVEAKLAVEYAKLHSRNEILATYLNSVPYGTLGGQTAVGVQAAAQMFFDKPASQLTLTQSALLAGLPQAPSQSNPVLYPQAARERRNEVLAKMAQLHYITPAQATAAEAAPLGVKHGTYYTRRTEDFFFEYVRQQLIERYGQAAVERGGLTVYTTIDLHKQYLARRAIAEILDEPGDPAAAIVTIHPANGYIETMAESKSYEESQFNLAAEGYRQPGSTFKAIDLAEALTRGVDPETTYYLSHTLAKGWLASDPEWEVHTFGGESLDKAINLVQATITSDNTVYAQLAADLGEKSITEMAHKLGVTSAAHLQSYPPESLGGLGRGVTPLEMADVYATLASGGYRDEPIAITKVVFPNGHVDSSWGKPQRTRVLSPAVDAEETKILHENVLQGTATRSGVGCETAAKTGTTTNFVDAWLDGYTGNYATAVWMGYPNKDTPMTDVHGEAQQGGYLAAEIWHTYMQPVVEGGCVPLPSSSETITYKPFLGHFSEGATHPYVAPPTVLETPTYEATPTPPAGATEPPANGGTAPAPAESTGATEQAPSPNATQEPGAAPPAAGTPVPETATPTAPPVGGTPGAPPPAAGAPPTEAGRNGQGPPVGAPEAPAGH
jgi:penicillin-binding protein 1A